MATDGVIMANRGLDLFDRVTRPSKRIEAHQQSQALEPFRLALSYIDGESIPEVFGQLSARVVEASAMGSDDNPKLAIRALEIVDERAQREFLRLEHALDGATLPLSADLHDALEAAFEFIDTLALHFSKPARALIATNSPLPSYTGLDSGLYHAVLLLERRAVMSYRVWSSPPMALWGTLYDTFMAAFAQGMHKVKMSVDEETIEHIFSRIVLLALSEPPKASPGDLQRIDHLLKRFVGLTRISDSLFVAPSAVAFSIGQRGPRNEVLREDQVRKGKDKNRLMIEVTDLVEKVEEFTETFKLGYAPAELQLPEDADAQAWFALLERLQGHWAGNKTRRFERKAYHPRVDVIVGIKDIWNFLQGSAFKRRAEDKRVDNAKMPPTSEWAVTDQSAGGFALRLVSSSCPPLGVGNIVAVRFRDHSAVYICIARRLYYRDLVEIELGLESLSPRAVPVQLYVTSQGEVQREHALLFNSLPGRITTPVLMIPARRTALPRYAEIDLAGSRKTIEFGAPLLKNGTLSIFRMTLSPGQPAQLAAQKA
jgi:hypothetical protein